jgi:hypothetical protein
VAEGRAASWPLPPKANAKPREKEGNVVVFVCLNDLIIKEIDAFVYRHHQSSASKSNSQNVIKQKKI